MSEGVWSRVEIWSTLVVGAAAALLACSDGASPPLEELGLREALEASPVVVASLPPSVAVQIRDRIRAARETPAHDLVIASAPGPELASADVQSVDGVRASLGEDAFVGYALVDDNGARRATALAPSVAGGDDGAWITLLGERDPATLAIEDAAIVGSARPELAALAQHGVQRFVRVEGWPAAVVVRGDTAYVNASWLVLEGAALPTASVASPIVTRRTTTPSNAAPARGDAKPRAFVSTSSTQEPLPKGATSSSNSVCDGCVETGCYKTKICKHETFLPCCDVSPARLPADETSLLFVLAPVAFLAVMARRRRGSP
ncbi:MAG TPA: hypothetical protein VLT33_43180 [Labilithrix sp.]|nr:hypothetical protein [Labilithrix sp.]